MTTYLSQWRTIIGVGERGVMGAPRSHHRRGIADHGPSPGYAPAWPTPRRSIVTAREGPLSAMLRIIHTADVHLGARHDDLGEQAAAQRERQFAAFKAAIDLALAEKVDLFLIAGDLFDSNVQPRRSVERVAAELKRLAEARIRSVIIPGTHDVLRPRVDLPRLRPRGDGRLRARRRPGDDPRSRAPVGPPARARRGRPRPGVRHEARAAQPARGPVGRVGGDRRSTTRHRRPRPGGSGWSTARSPSRAGPSTTRS